MKPVCCLIHHKAEPPRLLGEVIVTNGLALTLIEIFNGQEVPRTDMDFSALVVMGGPMSVYEQVKYPHLKSEIALIRRFIEADKPIIGICLGSQLIAHALGAEVYREKVKEIGWHPLYLTDNSEESIFYDCPKRFMGFHWHGDVFSLPDGANSLSSSDMTTVQSFKYGNCCYGILFHLEIDRTAINEMLLAFDGEVKASHFSSERIRFDADAYLSDLAGIGAKVFTRWVKLVS